MAPAGPRITQATALATRAPCQRLTFHEPITNAPGLFSTHLQALIAKVAVIGKVAAVANGKALGEVPIVALADVERAGFFMRIKQRIAGWFSK